MFAARCCCSFSWISVLEMFLFLNSLSSFGEEDWDSQETRKKPKLLFSRPKERCSRKRSFCCLLDYFSAKRYALFMYGKYLGPYSECEQWYKKAFQEAKKSNDSFVMGLCYWEGRGRKQNNRRAMDLMRREVEEQVFVKNVFFFE